jgi:hypothetical protein
MSRFEYQRTNADWSEGTRHTAQVFSTLKTQMPNYATYNAVAL